MFHIINSIELPIYVISIIAFILVLIYEIINGFHDTANAITTVIYTNALKVKIAVIMSGLFNFYGVIFSGLSVAYAIVHLLPIELLTNINSAHGLIMLFSMLLSAIIWNISTWYFGLPASSSHTLIGAIIGVSITNSIINHHSILEALNIPKLLEIFTSLVISPFIGFILSICLILILKIFVSNYGKYKIIYSVPTNSSNLYLPEKKPPLWLKLILVLSSAGVSFSHGANDGQKGIGLIMLILISITPVNFILNMNTNNSDILHTKYAILDLKNFYSNKCILNSNLYSKNKKNFLYFRKENKFYCSSKVLEYIEHTYNLLNNLSSYNQLNNNQRFYLHNSLINIINNINKLAKLSSVNDYDKKLLMNIKNILLSNVEYAPKWVITTIAVALSLGTMVGWKRISVTIGERIGKSNMTYAHGFVTQTTAALSIGVASYTGMPVSTTHIVSSAIMGVMLVDGKGIQLNTIKNILITWLLTLPISILISSILYWLITSV
ncbi:MAG: inorganic phosphate transporter [Candidatus Lightella neohaematopini]|nr:inorganic phosphate transporter [Candidatus Lightella neohaematopini]MCV2529026.1 inorganic phosphate transporter [Candidatus Lightella neohaematopini]